MGETLTIEFDRKALLRLLIPLVVEQTLAITVGLADSVMVAQVGEAAVSAVSLVDSVNNLLIQIFAALATGGAVVAGQFIGRKELDKANRAAVQLLLFVLEASLVITALMYVLRPFVLGRVFGDIQPDVAAYCNTYYLIVEASTPFLALYSAGAALFRVMGNSRVSMQVSLVMNGVNVLGNALLIFVFHWGVEGVAIPTLVSRVVAAILILALLHNPELPLHLEKKLKLHHDRGMIRSILLFGIPNGVENSMFQFGKLVLLSEISALGTAAVAANAIGNILCGFQNLPGVAIGLGMVTVISRCVGAGDYKKTRYYAKQLLKYCYGSIAVCSVGLCLLAPWILKFYDLSAEAYGYAIYIIRINTLFGVLIWPSSFTVPSALRAAGDSRFTMTASVASMWLFRVMLGLVLVRWTNLGVAAVWYAMYVDWAVRSVFFLLRFHSHRWERFRLKEE